MPAVFLAVLGATRIKLQVTSGKTSAALMLVLGLSVALPGSAGAVTLMDLLRGGPGKVARDRGELPPAGIVTSPSVSGPSADASDPEPLPRVSGPRYYDYKADTARAVNTANFNEDLANLKFSATPEIAKALEAYYGAGGKTLWVSGGELTERANAVIAFFETVGESGLDPADYSISAPAKDVTASISGNGSGTTVTGTPVETASASTSDAYQRAQMRFELALSAKVLAYVQDTTRGRVDPNRLSGYHDFKRKTVNLAPVLLSCAVSERRSPKAALQHRADTWQGVGRVASNVDLEKTGEHPGKGIVGEPRRTGCTTRCGTFALRHRRETDIGERHDTVVRVEHRPPLQMRLAVIHLPLEAAGRDIELDRHLTQRRIDARPSHIDPHRRPEAIRAGLQRSSLDEGGIDCRLHGQKRDGHRNAHKSAACRVHLPVDQAMPGRRLRLNRHNRDARGDGNTQRSTVIFHHNFGESGHLGRSLEPIPGSEVDRLRERVPRTLRGGLDWQRGKRCLELVLYRQPQRPQPDFDHARCPRSGSGQ